VAEADAAERRSGGEGGALIAGKSPLMNPNDAVAHPDGVAQAPDGPLYIGDSQKGKIWHVYYRGK
jgi:glucose/arabinose dehydrogenase